MKIKPADRAELNKGAQSLHQKIAGLKNHPLLPDVVIFHNAVRYALDDHMFYKPDDVPNAKQLLTLGHQRADQLKTNEHPWTSATGLVVRGYRSTLDDSVIPYGIDIPKGFSPRMHKNWRLDIWLHGRNNMLSEVRFLTERQKKPSQFRPQDTIVLHPYGRFCNAYKFAGEIDVLESVRHVQSQYSIDNKRIALRGFSMGGAGAWHLGAHHADQWAAVAPGAGFVDTAKYQNIFKKEPKPTWWEQKLWKLYDVPPIAGNFLNTTTVAYSGEVDKQKAAADIMALAFKREEMKLTHIIGPKTGHKYEPKAKEEVSKRVDAAVNKGSNAYANKVQLTTYTLRHNRMKWVSVHGLAQHWKEARVEAEYLGDYQLRVKTQNVTKLMLGKLKIQNQGPTKYTITIDGQQLTTTPDHHAFLVFLRFGKRWEAVKSLAQNNLAKTPGLQGPIDDAFLSRFVFVPPSVSPINKSTGEWVQQEMKDAISQWHRQFRGNVIVKNSSELSAVDRASNLILWGDPKSNPMIAKIAGQLPIEWTEKDIRIKNKSWPADRFVPVLIYPNPMNPRRYIVINSGFTFSEFGHMSNSMQNAKLPDYAVLDMRVPIAERIPKGVAHAGFFGENWQLTESEGND
jgi:S-formylglutathione hydrolase FrmB